MTTFTTADYARAYVGKYSLSLVPLPPRTKKPVVENWGNLIINTPEEADAYFRAHPDDNIGVVLGPSKLCSLDIDNEEAFSVIMGELGRSIDELKSGEFPVIQGCPPKFRLMFQVPAQADLDYHSLTWPNKLDPDGSIHRDLIKRSVEAEKSGETALRDSLKQEAKQYARFTVMELRASCTGTQRQDVFPPSIHPDTGKPYVWLSKPNGHFPEPPAWILTIWREWDKFKPQLQDMCPWAPKREIPAHRKPATPKVGQPSVIDAYNASTSLESALTSYGYRKVGRRWLSPHSSTGLPGVNLFDDGRCWIHHASDPLCSDESGQPVNAFDLFCCYEHGGDAAKAVKGAAEALQLKPLPRLPPQTTKQKESALSAPADEPQSWIERLDKTKTGLVCNLNNAVLLVEHDQNLAGQIWYDEFLDSIITTWAGPERRWRDADDILLQLYLQRQCGMIRISAQTAHDAAMVAAFHDVRNECRAWMESLTWDETPRLDFLMSEGFGAEHNDYSQAVGRCWVISMVARIFRPGCKVDTVPVFEGAQGAGKSTALHILGGKWFVECHESVMTKDFYGVLDGHMLVEIAEMHSFTRSEVERIKGVISNQNDRYRKAYGRNTEDHPRRSVLACTTNRDDWQRDDTGARRFWPILCRDINLDWLRSNRDNLFAEAVHKFKAGADWWDVPVESQREEAEKRRDADSWEPIVELWLSGRDAVTTGEVLEGCLKLEPARHDMPFQKRISRVLRSLGWVQIVKTVGGRKGKRVREWRKESILDDKA